MGLRCNNANDVLEYRLIRGAENRQDSHSSLSMSRAPAGEESAGRRVISRATAALVVAVLGVVLLAAGALLLHLAPAPSLIIGQENALLRFLGIASASAGTAALAAAACLAAASRLPAHSGISRMTLLALAAALAALG